MTLCDQIKNGSIGISLTAIDLYTSKTYTGKYESFVKGYGHDVLLPAAFIFSGCSAFELAQAIGWYHGTFDPKDFLAYAAGTAFALGLDSIITRKKKSIAGTVQ